MVEEVAVEGAVVAVEEEAVVVAVAARRHLKHLILNRVHAAAEDLRVQQSHHIPVNRRMRGV